MATSTTYDSFLVKLFDETLTGVEAGSSTLDNQQRQALLIELASGRHSARESVALLAAAALDAQEELDAAALILSSIPHGGTWGNSATLPTVQPIVFKTVVGGVGGSVEIIPASLNWKAKVILGSGVTATGGNTLELGEEAFGDTRPDGQAHLAVSLNIPENTEVKLNYQPL